MSTPVNRLHDLARGVNAWSSLKDFSFPGLDAGLVNRLQQGKPRPADFETVKAAHDDAVSQVPTFWPHDVVDSVTPQLAGYAHDLGILRNAMADALGIKEPAFPGLAALWSGIRNTFAGA